MPVTADAYAGLDTYTFRDDGYRSLYTVLNTVKSGYTLLREPSYAGYYGRVNGLYAEIRKVQSAFPVRIQGGRAPPRLPRSCGSFSARRNKGGIGLNRLSFRLPRRSMKTKLFLYMLVPVILILVLLASCLSLFDRFKTPKDTLAERLDMQAMSFEQQLLSHRNSDYGRRVPVRGRRNADRSLPRGRRHFLTSCRTAHGLPTCRSASSNRSGSIFCRRSARAHLSCSTPRQVRTPPSRRAAGCTCR